MRFEPATRFGLTTVSRVHSSTHWSEPWSSIQLAQHKFYSKSGNRTFSSNSSILIASVSSDGSGADSPEPLLFAYTLYIKGYEYTFRLKPRPNFRPLAFLDMQWRIQRGFRRFARTPSPPPPRFFNIVR